MRNIFTFLILFFSITCFAEQSVIDSLEHLLKTVNADTSKVKLLNSLSDEFISTGDYERGMSYAEKAAGLARQVHFSNGEATAYHNIGIIHSSKGNLDNAIEFFLKSLHIREANNDKEGMAASLGNIGGIYYAKDDFDKTLEYFSKTLAIYQELDSKKGMAFCYNNIGTVHKNKGEYDLAIEFFFKSLKMKEEMGNKKSMASSYNNIGNAYQDKGDAGKAIEYYSKGLAIYEEFGNKKEMAIAYNNIANLFLKTGKAKEAEKLSLKSLDIAKEIGAKDEIKDAYLSLSKYSDTIGNFKDAYAYHKLYAEIKDSIFNEESNQQITEMQTKYETEKKEQQITLLNKDKELLDAQMNRQKIIIWSVAGGLLVMLILSIFIFRERKKSEKLLLNILPVETARELKAHGKAKAKHYEQVTVMFTDFKGFTNIAEKLSAEELVSELDFLFKKFDEIISKYPIEKIKTIGDAYMCAGGLPAMNTTNAMDVVSAAIEIQSWMIAQNSKWNLRIGIHTGSVTAGVVGDKKFAYDIWGDAVNTASRMESSGEAGKINISGSTYEFISPLLEERGWGVRQRGKIPAKNKGEIDMYFVEKN